jgi:cellulose synthase/poly-beta-1,6-N-acetylglucosamine synthase-like glycosyltransferase
VIALWVGVGLWAYAYIGYPAILALFATRRPRRAPPPDPVEWPSITITLAVYNGAQVIGETLETLLAVDYPADKRQILVVSDASTDASDDIVTSFAARGVELLRLPERRGKTAAENAARYRVRGEIVVNTDASVRVHPSAVRRLVAEFADPSVGVASSRDISVARSTVATNAGEAAYVGYEMWVRELETRVQGIVGASGSLYAIRAELHRNSLPEVLSRDFAAALVARANGFRAVSVPSALCFVPRGTSLRREYQRKVRTMTRGLATLVHARALLNPLRFGAFAWMLASHKLCRWLLPWASVAIVAALAVLAHRYALARIGLGIFAVVAACAVAGWRWPEERRLPRLLAMPAFALAGVVAGLHAWMRLALGRHAPTWEPTRRAPVTAA